MLCSGSMELFGRVRRLRTPSGDRGHQTGDRLDEGAGEFVEDARRRPERQQVHYELYGVGRRLVDYVQRRQDHHDPRRRERRRRSCAGYRQVRGCLLLDAGGADEWLLDDAGSKIPVAGQDGKTPSVDEEGYWTIDGEPVKGADGRPVKAVGEDGDSFFEDVRQTDDEVIFILAGGETIRLPKAKEVNFVIERTTLTLKYGQTEKLAVTQKGVESYSISKPDGWRASLGRRRAVDHGSRRREYLCRKERQGDGRRRGRYGDRSSLRSKSIFRCSTTTTPVRATGRSGTNR